MLTRVMMHGRSAANPLLCGVCMGKLQKRPGGAEVDASVLFADVRGSTALAERSSPAEFRALLQRFYRVCGAAIERHNGVIDKFMGDGVMALFIPLATGPAHAAQAIASGRSILTAVRRSGLADAGLGVGCGIHSGRMFVGVMGTDDKLDFSALGDAVNVAARLAGVAAANEMVVSLAAWEAAEAAPPPVAIRAVAVAGRAAPLEVVSLSPAADHQAALG